MIKKQLIGGLLSLIALHSHLPADELSEECCQPDIIPGEPMVCGQLPSIYPQSASIDLGTCADIYLTADFIYWSTFHYGAIVGTRNTANGGTGLLYFKDHYHPGLKVGIGFDAGVVVLDAQYIRWHHIDKTNYSASPGQSLTPFALTEFFGLLLPPNYSQLRSKWKNNFDQFYFTMQKPLYLGTRLIATATIGVIAQWFTQNVFIDCIDEVDGLAPGSRGNVNSKHSNWSIGPAAGIRAKTLLGGGFTFLGNFDLALCYQRWTKGSDTLNFPPINPNNPLANSTEKYKISRTKAIGLSSLGLGWESYLACERYHLNLSVLYDIMTALGNTPNLEHTIIGDTYLHGWTLEARFDF